ncbi:MAG: formylglycine-generating enzyme family protein [Gammaproteobacteria bacterium]
MKLSKSFLIFIITVIIVLLIRLHFFTSPKPDPIIIGNGINGPKGMVLIPSGEFMMGSNSHLAKPNEKPAHKVHVDQFWIDQTDVTNAEFSRFVVATGYVTTAERKPNWELLKVQLLPGTPKPPENKLIAGAMVFVGTKTAVPLDDVSRWWQYVPGADWRHPEGPTSTIVGKENYPVVQVSYEDALTYAKWSEKRLPTEAEWEYAARGGIEQADYNWGDEFNPNGKRMANTFAGAEFPVVDPVRTTHIGTTQVKSYPPNGYALYDMAGNVWQWVSDWYRADAFTIEAKQTNVINPQGPKMSFDPSHIYTPSDAPERVIRGGSFLCDENYCMSYRPSARRGVDPYNPMSHIGFRLAMNAR